MLLALLALAAVSPAIADAGPAGFSTPVVVGSGPGDMPDGSLGRSGAAALAWRTPSNEVVAVRGVPSNAAWGANEILASGAAAVSYVTVAVGEATVVAWTELRDGARQLVAAIASPGTPFAPPRVVAELSGYRPESPRLVATTSGRLVVIWRDYRPPAALPGTLRYALSAGGRDFGRPRVLTTAGKAPSLVATGDGGVIAAWRTRRGVRAARLATGADTFSASYVVSRSPASAGPRLAAGRDNTVLASWRSRSRLLTRRLQPFGPLQTLAQATRLSGAAALAVGADGSAIAAFTSRGRTVNRVSATSSDVTGRWHTPQLLARAPALTGPRAVISTHGDALVLWARYLDLNYPARSEVLVARRTRRSTRFDAPLRLGPGPPNVDFGGVVLTQRGGTILAAWSSPDGGMVVASRPDR